MGEAGTSGWGEEAVCAAYPELFRGAVRRPLCGGKPLRRDRREQLARGAKRERKGSARRLQLRMRLDFLQTILGNQDGLQVQRVGETACVVQSAAPMP